jgi:ElaB/YqjD/DUF883 family membrane-anchored ribosome-binding protein
MGQPTPGADAAREGTANGHTERRGSGELTGTARSEARDLVDTTRGQASRVADEAVAQARTVVEDATELLHDEARHQTDRAAERMHEMGDQLQALAEGRPEDAGPMDDYARRAAAEVTRFADRIEEQGFDGVVRDVETFARRRPALFLAGAAVAGLLVGRLGRNRDAEAT